MGWLADGLGQPAALGACLAPAASRLPRCAGQAGRGAVRNQASCASQLAASRRSGHIPKQHTAEQWPHLLLLLVSLLILILILVVLLALPSSSGNERRS